MKCECPNCGHEFEASPAGAHRLLCGDAEKAADVERLLAGAKPLLMVTDPPYGVDYHPEWRNETGRSLDGTTQRAKTRVLKSVLEARSVGRVKNDDRADWREAWKLFPGDVAYVWHAGQHASAVEESITATGFEIRAQIIWAKHHFVISRGDYHWQHEPCWYAVRKGSRASWQGDRTQTTVWSFPNNNSFGNANPEETTGHGTQKPVEAMRRPMLNNTKPMAKVYDPFVGSGTSIIAAETIGRSCLAIDIDPIYVDVAVQRWQKFANGVARLESGESFEEVAAARVKAAA